MLPKLKLELKHFEQNTKTITNTKVMSFTKTILNHI